jgi:branched-chain amino acid transport system substrate-binding protein
MFLRKPLSLAAIAVFAAVCMVGMSACGSSGSSSSSGGSEDSSGSYKIGFTDSLTGALSVFTQPELKWAKAIFNTVNQEGGVNGHKIELTALDQGDTGSGQASANVTQLATSDHVSAILGMLISNDCESAASLAERYETPLICQRAGLDNIEPPEKFLFLDTDLEAMEVEPQLEFVQGLIPGNPKPSVAIFNSDETGANQWAERWESEAEAAGMEVTTTQKEAATATNLDAQIAAIVQSEPEVVLTEIFPQFYEPLLKALHAAGQDPPIVTTSGSIFGSLLESLGDEELYETTIARPLNAEKPENKEQKDLVAQLAKVGMKSTADVNDIEGTMYAPGPYAVVAALEKCGYPCSGSDMADALTETSTKVAGLVPNEFGYTPDLHIGVKDFVFMHWDPKKKELAVVDEKPAGKPAQE